MSSKKPSEDQIKLMRDAFLEAYVRRNPHAQPEPGTSLYAVLEATGAVIAGIMANVEGADEAIRLFLEADRDTTISPDPDESAYSRLVEVVERDPETGEVLETKDIPGAADEWPCIRNSEGTF